MRVAIDKEFAQRLATAGTTRATGIWVEVYDPDKGQSLVSEGTTETAESDHGSIGSFAKTLTARGIL